MRSRNSASKINLTLTSSLLDIFGANRQHNADQLRRECLFVRAHKQTVVIRDIVQDELNQRQ